MNPYELLGVSRDATDDDIQKAYRQRAKQMHPDGEGSTESFIPLKAARDLLLDPKRRRLYDETGVISQENPIATKTQQIINLLAAFLIEVVRQLPDVDRVDILDAVKGCLTHAKTEMIGQQKEREQMIGRCDRVIRRLKRRDGDDDKNFLIRVLQHHREICMRQHTEVKAALELHDEALRYIDEYYYGFEAQVSFMMRDLTFATHSTGTSQVMRFDSDS